MQIPPTPLIALIDDEENIRTTLEYALKREGYRVQVFSDGLEAWEGLKEGLPDLVILDIIMPGMDGLDLCRKIRTISEKIPLIFLTSRDEEIDRVLGLELGADDYLCKPFSVRELMTRIKVLFRRAALNAEGLPPEEKDTIRLGPLILDTGRFTVSWENKPVHLTVTEFRLLQSLARQPGQVKTRAQLMEEAYPNDAYMSDRTIDSHIKRLRKKFVGADPGFSGIETIYGLGYRYKPE
jgi:two-component system response regulator ChvI